MSHSYFFGRVGVILFLLTGIFGKDPLFGQNIGVNGTGNNPDPSAMLHVEAPDKGLLIPRVALNDTATQAPIAVTPAEGLVIYNETGSEPKGFYYWDAGKGQWIQVGTGAQDDDWTRDPAEGQMFPSNLGDSIGIGVQEPNAELDILGRDVDLGSNRAAVKVTDQGDGDTLYMDGDEIVGGLGGGAGEEQALYLQLNASEDLVLSAGSGNSQVGIGSAANYPRNDIKLDVDHQSQDIAVRGEGYYGPTMGYLGVQGSNNFDGVSSADWSGDEIGVVGISTGGSGYDNYGVIGHATEWGGRFEHNSSGTFVELGGDPYAARIVDGNEADGYILTSDAAGNATWEDPADLSSIDTLRDNDWYYESSDSSLLRDYGTEEDCVLVGDNTGEPSYNYDLAVYNGTGDGTRMGMGSVEYFEDGLNLFQFYGGDFYLDDNLEIEGSGLTAYELRVGNNDAAEAYFDLEAGTDEDVLMDDDGGQGTIHPNADEHGFLGSKSYAWYYEYRYNEVNVSLRSKKKDVKEFENAHYDRAMKDIREMDMAFYRYKSETAQFKESDPTRYRPTPHIGTFVGEVPDYVKDNTFSGILTDGYASLAMAGVKQLDKRMRRFEEEYRKKTVEDFGSSELESGTVEIEFNPEFRKKLEKHDELPVISLASIGKDGELFIKEKSKEGFVVASSRDDGTVKQFDWTARARIVLKKEEDRTERSIKVDLEVDESEKDFLKNFKKAEKRKEKAERKEAIRRKIQEARRKGGEKAVKELKQRLRKEGVDVELEDPKE